MLRKGIRVAERRFGPDSLTLAPLLNELGICFKYLARFSEAGRLYQRALSIIERKLGVGHVRSAALFHNLGGLEHAAGNWTRGEQFAREGLRIRRCANGDNHPDVAADMAALAALLDPLKRYDESERLYRRAIAIYETARRARTHRSLRVL